MSAMKTTILCVVLLGFVALASCGYGGYSRRRHHRHRERHYLHCPASRPFKRLGKCYSRGQQPDLAKDQKSVLPLGHNFIMAGRSANWHGYYGLHVAVLRIKPHIYSTVVEFDVKEESCRRRLDALMAARKQPRDFALMQYNATAIKLPELVKRKDHFNVILNRQLSTEQIQTPLMTCKVSIRRLLDLRRFVIAQPFPSKSQYLLFGEHGKYYISHLAVNCYDFQQLISIYVPWYVEYYGNLKNGIVITLPGIPGQLPTSGVQKTIADPITKSTYLARSLEINPYHRTHDYFPLRIKKKINFEERNINIGCPSPAFIVQS